MAVPPAPPAPLIPSPEATRAASVVAQPNNGSTAPLPTANPNRAFNENVGSTPPASTASFAGRPTGTMSAPSVVTSQAAQDHLGEMKTALEKAQTDLQNLRTYKSQAANPPQTTDTGKTPTNTPPTMPGSQGTEPEAPSSKPNDLDAEINSILEGLSPSGAAPQEEQASPEEAATVQNDQEGIQQDQEAQTQVASSLDSMAAGTYPLSPAEQAQVDSIKTQYAGALKAAQDYETAKGLGATAAVAANGMEEYSPAEAMGTIHAAINEGAAKVTDVNTRIINAQAKLTQALQSDDYKTASKLYTQISGDIKLRSDEISKISTALTKSTDTLQKNALAVAKLQITSLLNSDKISITDKQNQVNNAIKSGALDEKTRHDVATELASQVRASKSGITTKPPADSVATTEKWINGTRGQDGYADPNAYKQAFDAWINDGYAAKDFVKNYPPKDFVNPTNDWLPKYLASKTSSAAAPTDIAAQIQQAFPTTGNFNQKPTGGSWVGI